MIYIFWLITAFLVCLAFAFLWPWLRLKQGFWLIVIGLPSFCYAMYFVLGAGAHLKQYYSESVQKMLAKHEEIRPLMSKLRRQAFKLKMRLEKDPLDLEAEWQLLEILGIEALEGGDKTLALAYWKEALKKMPIKPENELFRMRIMRLKMHLEKQ